MTPENDLREQLATCTRIFAMQGLIGLFGHVSVYQPESKTIFVTPGSGSDKPRFQATDMIPIHLDGKAARRYDAAPHRMAHSYGTTWRPHRRVGSSASSYTLCDAVHDRQT